MNNNKEKRFFHESLQDCQTIKDFIQTLQDGLEKGEINLSSNSEALTIYPPKIVKFSVKAKKKSKYTKLDLKLTWEEEESSLQESSSLDISS